MTASLFLRAMRSTQPAGKARTVKIFRAGVPGVFASLAFLSAAGAADRAPVFAEVSAPHSYYWREMYVPQLTSGPSSVSWSRDGRSLFYSMQGRIWRQRIDGMTAEQVVSGPGYDYQPDLSPDGRMLVFARREDDAINLVLLDLKSGREMALTKNTALNFDARWSPDGAKIAYVTTEGTGNFHIAIAERAGGEWASRRWREETKTAAPRYYYSAADHELAPAWSPDGQEFVFVSNAGVVHGTGKIVRQKIDLSSPPEVIRDEETNWKAHPDWSPDGTRIVYSSYLGRQWHQLWMTTAASGGYPAAFSYGDFDLTSARWSLDGSRIAAVSNESGGLAIEIIDVIGGARKRLKTEGLSYRQPMSALALSIRDVNGRPAAARVEIRASDGRDYAPSDALIRADDYRDPARSVETHYFHTDGDDIISLPPGVAEIRVWRGLSSTPLERKITLVRGSASVEITLDDLAKDFTRWRSGDVHVHMNYGGAYRMDRGRLAQQADAEALDLVFNLIVNKEQRIPDIAEFSPAPDREERTSAVIAEAQEFHTSVWGHLGLIGLDDHVLIADYAGYPQTAMQSLYPDNATVAELAHRQNAAVGYVHPFDPPPPDPFAEGELTYALPADAALGRIDYVEIVGFSDHRITENVWHRLLNCGLRIPAAGGTDAMTNYASMRGPVGLDRTYVDLGAQAPEEPQVFVRAWLDALKAGRSFATNSALLDLRVEGEGPGGDIRFRKGAHRLKFEARMESIAAIDSLELVVNGEVVERLPVAPGGRSAAASGEIVIDRSSWIALRASAAKPSADVFDLYPYAVTSPVYVTVAGKAQRSREDADFFIAWIDRLIAHARDKAAFNTDAERAIVLQNFENARKEFERRR